MSDIDSEVSSSSDDEVSTDVDSNIVVVNDLNVVNVEIEHPDMAELRKYLDTVAEQEGINDGPSD